MTAEPRRIRVLAADDERPALDALVRALEAEPAVGEVLRAGGGPEALRLLAEHEVDAAFLDIHMPGLDGFDLARALRRFERTPAVVFVTADEAGAVSAFDLDAVDYLLKPIRRERLGRAVARVVADRAEPPAATDADETIPVRVGRATRIVHRRDVRFVQSQGDYLRLVTADSSHLIRASIAELEERWRPHGFIRVHRSFLVDGRAISSARLSGEQPSVTVDGTPIPVSRRLVRQVREAMFGRPGG